MEDRLPWRTDIHYHERQAAHLRELASTTTTAPVKTRLLAEAEFHDRIARGEPAPSLDDE